MSIFRRKHQSKSTRIRGLENRVRNLELLSTTEALSLDKLYIRVARLEDDLENLK